MISPSTNTHTYYSRILVHTQTTLPYTHIQTHDHTYMRTDLYTDTYTHYARTHIHTHMHAYTVTHTTHMHTRTHIHTKAHMQIPAHTHMHITYDAYSTAQKSKQSIHVMFVKFHVHKLITSSSFRMITRLLLIKFIILHKSLVFCRDSFFANVLQNAL